MLKHVMYHASLITVLFLASCKCPSCCCQHDNVKQQEEPKTQTSATKDVALSPILVTSAEQFKAEISNATIPVIADFSAEWCGACKASLPTFNEVAKQLSATYKFLSVDVDKVEKLAQEFGILGIPTFIFFKNGKEVHRITGAITQKENFISTIEKTFGK